jgi:hypothetical protein
MAAAHLHDRQVENATQLREAAERRVLQFIAAHPGLCLGAALSVGMAIGWWVKRK